MAIFYYHLNLGLYEIKMKFPYKSKHYNRKNMIHASFYPILKYAFLPSVF